MKKGRKEMKTFTSNVMAKTGSIDRL